MSPPCILVCSKITLLCRAWVHTTQLIDADGLVEPDNCTSHSSGAKNSGAISQMRPIDNDEPIVDSNGVSTCAWETRALPATASPDDERIAVLRSRRWPGAVAVSFSRNRWTNVYVGDGLPLASAPTQLQLPAPLPTAAPIRASDGVSLLYLEQDDVVLAPEAAVREATAAAAEAVIEQSAITSDDEAAATDAPFVQASNTHEDAVEPLASAGILDSSAIVATGYSESGTN